MSGAGSGRHTISADEWRQIVDSAVETAIVTTDLGGRVTSWSEGARRIFGWTDDLPFVLFFPAVIGASILFNHALGLFATARAL